MQIIVAALGVVFRWLLAGFLGRLFLSVFTQGAVIGATLLYSGEMAEWASGKMIEFVRASQFWERLQQAFGGLGDFPAYVLQLWGCLGAHEVLVALIGGQISAIGVALICRRLL